MNVRNDAYETGPTGLPNQMVSTAKKMQKKWQKDTMDYFLNSCGNRDDSHRKSYEEMLENINLYRGYVDSTFMDEAFDPLGLDKEEGMNNELLKTQNYNILRQPMNTLLGEELKRRSDLRAIAINSTAINAKDLEFRKRMSEFLKGYAQLDQIEPGVFEEELKKIDKWRKYDLQSAHEVMANQILQYYIHNSELNLRKITNEGFKNLLALNEEIYRIDKVGDESVPKLVHSPNFYVFGLGNNTDVTKGYAWVEFEYMHPNQILERYHELSVSDIKKILTYNLDTIDEPIYDLATTNGFDAVMSRGKVLTLDTRKTDAVDKYGNIRVVTFHWISLRKLLEVTYYDEYGDEQKMYVDENFPVSADMQSKPYWVNEIWKGTRIGEDIDTEVGPSEIQMRSITNPKKVKPPYAGVIIPGKSFIDELKPYLKDFNVWMHKLKTLWVQHVGKAAIVDVSKIPSWMTTEEWFFWLKNLRIAFENPFEESNKGQLAGMMQQSKKEIDLSLNNEITQALQTLSWIKVQIDEMSGVSRQRQGEIAPSDGLGTSQQAITQSSYQTEVLFTDHEHTEVSLMTALLEHTKVTWKDAKVKRQYIMDDLSNTTLDVDGTVLAEAEYGVQVTSGSRLAEMDRMLDLLSHAAMQTGTATLSDVARMKLATSPSEMLAELASAEDKRIKQQQEMQKIQADSQERIMQMQMQAAERNHQMELEKIHIEQQYKLELEKMKLADKARQDVFNKYYDDDNRDGVEDQVEIDKANIQRKIKEDEIRSKEKMFDKQLKQEKELELKKLQTQKEIANINKINKSKSK